MKRILLILLVLFASSCSLTQHYTKYIDENQYGRMYLKEMKFKNSFNKKMSNKIGGDAVYFNYYENPSIDYKSYGYIRFFNTGQYAVFSSKTENIDINDIQKANFVGYYNIENNILLMEMPNTSFSKAGKRVIREFEITENTLKEIRKKNQTEQIYTKVNTKELRPLNPDW